MKLQIEVQRTFQQFLSNLPPSINNSEHLEDIDLDESVNPLDRFSYLDSKNKRDWSITIVRKIWRKFELARFLSETYRIYKSDTKDTNFKSIRRMVKRFIDSNDKIITLEICPDPQIIMIGVAYNKCSSILDKMMVANDSKDIIYWLPKKGLLFSKVHSDEYAEDFLNKLQENVTGPLEEIRLRAMDLTKYYKQESKITKVRISSAFEITGFTGLDHLEFKGDDIKKGVYGLQQRQEIDIRNLGTGLGPNVEIASDKIHLYIGSKVGIRALEGIDDLARLIEEKED